MADENQNFDTEKLLSIAMELLMNVAPRAVAGSTDALRTLKDGTELLRQMNAEGERDPTADEWDKLNAEIDDLARQAFGN